MSGKRILDAVALLSASRNIAVKHFEIRLAQADLYSKTSSIGKAIRSRTGRAAPSVYAAAQSFSNSASNASQGSQDTSIPAHESVTDLTSDAQENDEPMSDHHYERSSENTAIDPIPQEELHVEQEKAKRAPLPDGTIPPNDSPINTSPGDPESFSKRPTMEVAPDPLGTGKPHQDPKVAASRQTSIPQPTTATTGLSSEQAKILQRQSESQIPAHPAEPPPSTDEFGVEQEQDVFYQPPGTTSPVLSALPRIRVPKVEWDVQGGDPHVTGGINPDVYYSGREPAAPTPVPEEEPTEEIISQLFNSSKVSRMLGNKGIPNSGKVRTFHTSVRQLVESQSEKEDMKKLADDMAKDLHGSQAVSERITVPSTAKLTDRLTGPL
jgi:aarF domain-containing kinase